MEREYTFEFDIQYNMDGIKKVVEYYNHLGDLQADLQLMLKPVMYQTGETKEEAKKYMFLKIGIWLHDILCACSYDTTEFDNEIWVTVRTDEEVYGIVKLILINQNE